MILGAHLVHCCPNGRKCGLPGFLSGLPWEGWCDMVQYGTAWDVPCKGARGRRLLCAPQGGLRRRETQRAQDWGIAGSGALSQWSPSGHYLPPQHLCREMWWWKHVRFSYRGLKWQFGIYNSSKIILRSSTKGQLVFFYHNTSELRSCERAQCVESYWLFNLLSLQSNWVYLVAET